MRELSLNIMDIAQNSLAAGASLIEIEIREDSAAHVMDICISDNGAGMTDEQLKMAADPFFSTKPGHLSGLGLPFFKMSAEQTGGSFVIESENGSGTKVFVRYDTSHIDMTPLGDINETVALLILCNPNVNFIYTRTENGKTFTLDTKTLPDGAKAYPAILNLLVESDITLFKISNIYYAGNTEV